jgi:hypothetical protein
MSSYEAARCHHVKTSGTQCGSPALRNKPFCYYHQQYRPIKVECYYDGPYALGQIFLPEFEDAHSVQMVIRQVVQMLMQKRLESKTASLVLYAMQIASSNLKRISLEQPSPEDAVVDPETDDEKTEAVADNTSRNNTNNNENSQNDDNLPPHTIQACQSSNPLEQTERSRNQQRIRPFGPPATPEKPQPSRSRPPRALTSLPG